MPPYINQKTIGERLDRARKRLIDDPYDIESWKILVKDAKSKSIEVTRDFFEKLVSHFPNYGKFWKLYIEAEMQNKNYEKVEKLFQRSLIKVLNIDLWICYLTYIKEAKANQPSFKEKLAQAFEFAIEKVGLDVRSYPIWAAHIEFLKGLEAVGSYAENQRIAAVRKLYHRACTTPVHNMELLWRDYIAYEQGINPLIAKKMVDEHSKEYMNSRRALKEMEAITRGLDKNSPPIPPNHGQEEKKQMEIWRKYLKWEKCNPLNSEDINYIIKRVSYGYDQVLLSLSHHQDMWIDAIKYLENSSKLLFERGDISGGKLLLDRMSELLDRATSTFFTTNMLMHFFQADFEETRENHTKVENIYEKLLSANNVTTDINYSLVYIQYMRYARRVSGIKGARITFKKARDDNRTTHHIYTCAALMEYYCSKDKSVALKIFELGLKKYSFETAYLLDYVDFLQSLNDDNNTRVLFERLLNSIAIQVSPEKTLTIWNRFLDFEGEVGDLANIHKVDQRRIASFNPNLENADKTLKLLMDRFRYRGLLPIPTQPATAADKISTLQKLSQIPNATTYTPDERQMLPFKPQKNAGGQSFIIPGGVFAAPPAVSSLLNALPSPAQYMGPFVMIDHLLTILNNWNASQTAKEISPQLALTPRQLAANQGSNAQSSPNTTMSPKTTPGQLDEAGISSSAKSAKRFGTSKSPLYRGKIGNNKTSEEYDDFDDNGPTVVTPPVNDIYRMRQQKKVK